MSSAITPIPPADMGHALCVTFRAGILIPLKQHTPAEPWWPEGSEGARFLRSVIAQDKPRFARVGKAYRGRAGSGDPAISITKEDAVVRKH